MPDMGTNMCVFVRGVDVSDRFNTSYSSGSGMVRIRGVKRAGRARWDGSLDIRLKTC